MHPLFFFSSNGHCELTGVFQYSCCVVIGHQLMRVGLNSCTQLMSKCLSLSVSHSQSLFPLETRPPFPLGHLSHLKVCPFTSVIANWRSTSSLSYHKIFSVDLAGIWNQTLALNFNTSIIWTCCYGHKSVVKKYRLYSVLIALINFFVYLQTQTIKMSYKNMCIYSRWCPVC